MSKLKKLICVLLICTLLYVPTISIGAQESSSESIKIEAKEYSERYLEWLSLDEETRAKTIAPPMHEIEYKPKLVKGLSADILPSRYTLDEEIDITIKNQKQTGECWAFATLSALETNLALTQSEANWDFSERHMDYSTSKTFTDGVNPNGHERELGEGGNDDISMGYITSGRGPILEEDMPFENDEEKKPLSYITGTDYEVQKKVEDYVTFPNILKSETFAEDMTEFRNKVKQHIMTYGSVNTVVVTSGGTLSKYTAFDGAHLSTYCNSTSDFPDHAVSIVGWDDNYAVENFKEGVRPSNPGAYIIRNSWGTGAEADVAEKFGSEYTGYDYISYEDYYVEYMMTGIINVTDVDYDSIYQHDILGSSSYIELQEGTQIPVMYGANVFTKETNEVEELSEIGLAIKDDVSSYEVYVNTLGDSLETSNLTKVTGTVSNLTQGYATIEFDSPVYLSGSKFAVVVKYTVPTGYPFIAVEGPVGFSETAKANANESFIKEEGTEEWIDITSIPAFANTNLSIKAFTSEVEESTKDIDSPKYEIDNTYISKVSPNTTVDTFIGNIISDYEVKIYNKNDEEITGTTKVVTGGKITVNGKTYTLIISGDTDGDGDITPTDLSRTRRHLAELEVLSDIYKKSIELTEDGAVTPTDLSKIRRHLAEIELIGGEQ